MSMRLKTTILIIFIVFVTTAANFLISLYFTTNALQKTVEQDLTFAIAIADKLVGTKMDLIKSEAQTIAERLPKDVSNTELFTAMQSQSNDFPHISALTVFDRGGIIVNYSEPPHEHDVELGGKYMEAVFNGASLISSPFYCPVHGEYVMNVYTPVAADRILAITIPGSTFSDMLSGHTLWKTGNIFMVNEEGGFVGGADPEIVRVLNNYSVETSAAREQRGQRNITNAEVRSLVEEILSTEEGVYTYHFEGVENLCAYSRIRNSTMGWRVAVTVPIKESPQAEATRGHIYAVVFFLLIGVITAFFLAALTAQPFKKIETQNHDLEQLYKTIQSQAAAIKEEHGRIKLMLDATPLACRLWSKDLKMLDCNEAAVKLFGVKDKREYIERYLELSPKYQSGGMTTEEKLRISVMEAFEKGSGTHDWMYQTFDGTPIPSEITLVRIPYGDDYVVASYSRDLREQKKMIAEIEERDAQLEIALADAREANNAKSNFLAHMSHEIRTPLNAIIGLSELTLGEGNMSSEAETNLEKISGAGSTILSIVNDILDISKIESGKFETYPVHYDTPSLINDVITLNIVRVGEKPISFKLYVDDALPVKLLGDDLRVKQIFNNLLSNAFKYTASGTVEWRIAFEREGESVWINSSVADTGLGIKPDDLKKLFSDYNQVDAKSNRRVEGTGLGLAITKRLVEMMNGTIAVESEYGKGSVFRVRLRQTFVSATPIGKEVAGNLMSLRYKLARHAEKTKQGRVDLSHARVLVVDDVVTNLDVVKGMMKPYKVKIDCTTSGPQAIEMIRLENPLYNAIFMDHMMPGMDGIEAARIIREEIGTDYAKNIPIIALTANAIVGNEEMFLNHGFQDFISKPIDMIRLDAVLRRWLKNKESGDELSGTARTKDSSLAANDNGGDNNDESGESLLRDISLSGIDTTKIQERFGGSEKIFIDVLRSYAANTPSLLTRLREYLAAGNLQDKPPGSLSDYGIVVHGIKGASYGIFAEKAGAAAEKLELAAKAGNLDAIQKSHPDFERTVEALLGEITGALAKIDAAANRPEAEAPDAALLKELREACGDFDMERADKAMEALEAFRYTAGGKLVAWLRGQLTDMSFETIAGGEWPNE